MKRDKHFDYFEVPYEEGMSMLHSLRWIRGEVECTCIAKLTPDAITVEPLPKRPLIRDLVTDVIREDERLDEDRSVAEIENGPTE
jgi:succinate dehydrogenase/fumarate reductase-like Fe-S protein